MMNWKLLFTVAMAFIFAPALLAQSDSKIAAWSAPEREIMVPVEGGEVYVRVNGDIENCAATPAVFIHGGPGGDPCGFCCFAWAFKRTPHYSL